MEMVQEVLKWIQMAQTVELESTVHVHKYVSSVEIPAVCDFCRIRQSKSGIRPFSESNPHQGSSLIEKQAE